MPSFHYITNLVAVASFAGVGLAQLGTMISLLPPGGIEEYGSKIAAVWNRPSNVISSADWETIPAKRGLVPVACTADFGGDWLSHFKSSDMRVYDVTYDDCDQVFQLCIHKDVKVLSHSAVIRVCTYTKRLVRRQSLTVVELGYGSGGHEAVCRVRRSTTISTRRTHALTRRQRRCRLPQHQ
jgi:hypothetical protein